METGGLSRLPAAGDWQRPWFAPFAVHGQAVAEAVRGGAALHEALNARRAAPVRFVPQSALSAGEAYEAHIFREGACPTRDNAHDFFNGLVWMHFPRCKQQLNRVQAGEIGRSGVGPVRGPVRDAVTLLDENGALLDAPGPLWAALLARDWRRAFIDLRPAWDAARLVVFGHALLEKLQQPRKDLTAHVWRSPVPLAGAGSGPDLAGADAFLAPCLVPQALASKPFTPLPVLGIPGWCDQSENFSFYDDSFVFRPPRP